MKTIQRLLNWTVCRLQVASCKKNYMSEPSPSKAINNWYVRINRKEKTSKPIWKFLSHQLLPSTQPSNCRKSDKTKPSKRKREEMNFIHNFQRFRRMRFSINHEHVSSYLPSPVIAFVDLHCLTLMDSSHTRWLACSIRRNLHLGQTPSAWTSWGLHCTGLSHSRSYHRSHILCCVQV